MFSWKHLVISIMLIGFFICSATADPSVMVTSYSLNPSIVMPGDEVELTVVLTNTETTATTTQTSSSSGVPTIQTVRTNPATINNIWIVSDGGSNSSIKAHENYEDFGDLSPSSSATISFKLTTSQNITQGPYFPILKVDVDSAQSLQYPIQVMVSNLTVDLIESEVPDELSTTGATSISLHVVNQRGNTVNNVMVTPSCTEDVCFSPVQYYVGSLAAETTETVSFLVHSSVLEQKNLTFTVKYSNGNNVHSSTLSTVVEFVNISDVSPVMYSVPESIAVGESKPVSLEVYNAKSGTINGVTVIPISNLKVTPPQYFIGSMDKDDVFSTSFDVAPANSTLGNASLSFKVLFKQGNNYYESPIISNTITIVKAKPVDTWGAAIATSFIIIFLIIICIVGYILWKRRRQKHGE